MPFESKFSKESIIDAAFEIAQHEGFKAITARSVAKRIQGSVAPIYFNFDHIDDLIHAVVEKVFKISQDILLEQTSPNLYENMGKAGFIFANRYPVFFRELVLLPNPYLATYKQIEEAMLEGLKRDPLVADLTLSEKKMLIFKVKALQIGFQTMIANHQLPDFMTQTDVENLFIELGSDLAQLERYKKEKKNE